MKTHVSRIFAKTGTANRTELSTWDGTPSEASRTALSRRFAAPLLGWLGGGASTAAKVAVGSAAGVVFVGVLVAVFATFGSDDLRGGVGGGDEPLTGYYMESTMEWAALSDEPVPIVERSRRGQQFEWRVDDATWRVEAESTSFGVSLAYSTIAVADGHESLVHDRLRDTWTRYPPGLPGLGIVPSLLGPADADDLDAFIGALGAEFDTEVIRAGTGERLGREVEVLEFELEFGTYRVSVDPVAMVVLHQEMLPHQLGRSVQFEVTRFEPQISMDRDLFELAPPASATVVDPWSSDGPDCPHGSEPVRAGTFYAQEGFLMPTHVPDAWTGGGAGYGGSECETMSLWGALRPVNDPEGPYILLDQARIPSGIPHWLAQGEPVDVAVHEGYRTTEANIERLIWTQDGVVAMLEGRDAPFEELLRIAESAYIVTDVPPFVTPTPAGTPPGGTGAP